LIDRLDLLDTEPFLLVPSKLLPHKNLALAVRLAAHLRRLTKHPLVLITGAPSPHEPEVSSYLAEQLRELAATCGAGQSLRLIPDVIGGPVAHETIRDLMLLADLVFLPSLEEGYGMPVREALVLRVPVLSTDIPAFRGAGGEAASYFSPHADPADVAAQALEIARSAGNVGRRAALSSRREFDRRLMEVAECLSPLTPLPCEGQGS
jgi:glycosyltransferase involved in cell wall biosynthesis